jgi:hypothetical protein
MQEPNNCEKLDQFTSEDRRILDKMQEILVENVDDEDEDVVVPDAEPEPDHPVESEK